MNCENFNMTVKEIRSLTGLTQAAFAEKFRIPKRTLEGWEAKENCAIYIRIMMAEILGLFPQEEK